MEAIRASILQFDVLFLYCLVCVSVNICLLQIQNTPGGFQYTFGIYGAKSVAFVSPSLIHPETIANTVHLLGLLCIDFPTRYLPPAPLPAV